jgi:hypothetical protein
VERNAPPIEKISVYEELDRVGVILSSSSYNDFVTNEQNGEDDNRFFHRKYFFCNWTEWRRLGRAVNSNPTIRCLTIRIDPHRFLNDHRFVERRARCLEAFYTELKNNKTIEHLNFLPRGDFLRSSSLGLIFFLQNNTNLKNLSIEAYLSPNHIDVLTPVLPRLETLTLWLNPNTATALAALLQDPGAKLQHLFFTVFQDTLIKTLILASLVGNTKLRSLKLGHGRSTQWFDDYFHNAFDNVLCDYSSLENICNSNHTLETVFRGGTPLHPRYQLQLSALTRDCLELNKIENKNKVIHNKVMRYYFVGDFDVTPFANMPLFFLPKIMSMIKGRSNQQNAVFKLLRAIPGLCNVPKEQ